SWIALSARELLDDDYSEIEYSDMDGEDDMVFDTPPYYHYEDDHLPGHLHGQYPQHYTQSIPPPGQGRSMGLGGKSDFATMSTSASAQQEQEQAEEALRASLSTLLATGPRPRYKQRRHRPRKIYTVDSRSSRSSPLVPASPTHLYFSTTASPHLRPSNPESILGDLSPNYIPGSFTPLSRDYDSASDSEAARQMKCYHRGILSTGDGPYARSVREYYEIESSTLDSNDPPFSGSTTPRTPPTALKVKPVASRSNSVTDNVLQSPPTMLAEKYMSWSAKAQSILDHASKTKSFKHGECLSAVSSPTTSPRTSPSPSGASTPSRSRRKRCPIPEPHQGFFSRALDQRALASHVSISRLGMTGTLCPPLHVGLRSGTLIRGSSPLRPTGGAYGDNTANPQYPFRTVASEGNEPYDSLDMIDGDDKENKRWYGQEIGLNLWQTTLGAAVRLGTGFGSGMVKKVHGNSVQLHPKELCQRGPMNTQQETLELYGAVQELFYVEDSGSSTLFDAEVPSLTSASSSTEVATESIKSLREQFLCSHPLAKKARRRFELVSTPRLL
ncbi:hypothetical protein BGW38_009257, partial [Lunasporangiospora selenospora]